jgi:hypothetical protein
VATSPEGAASLGVPTSGTEHHLLLLFRACGRCSERGDSTRIRMAWRTTPIRNALRCCALVAEARSNDWPIASARKSAAIARATASDDRAAELKAPELDLIFLSFKPRLDALPAQWCLPCPQPPPISSSSPLPNPPPIPIPSGIEGEGLSVAAASEEGGLSATVGP